MGPCSGKSKQKDGQSAVTAEENKKGRHDSITNVNPDQQNMGGTNKKLMTLPDEEQKGDNLNSDLPAKRAEKKKLVQVGAVSEKEEIFENIKKVARLKQISDMTSILSEFSKHFFFNQLQQSEKQSIIDKMFYCVVPDGEYVFKQDDKASSYFLIERGQCNIIINGEQKKVLKAGQAFGELALMFNAPRSASVLAVGDCGFWGIERNSFRKIIEDINTRERDENIQFLKKVKFLQQLTDAQKEAIAEVLIQLVYKKGENIVNEGDAANSYFIIKKGKVSAVKGGKELRVMTEGDSFEQYKVQYLYVNCYSIRGATVKAVDEEVKCLALGREDLTRILGDKIQSIMYNNLIKWAFEKDEFLSKLTKVQVEKVLLKLTHTQKSKDDVIYEKDTVNDKFIVVLEGAIQNQASLNFLVKGQLYGTSSLPEEKSQQKTQDTLTMQENGLIGIITFAQFFQCIGGRLEEVLAKNLNSHEVKYMKKYDQSQRKDYSYLILDQMIYIKKLGAGQFGNVYLVYNAIDKAFYAIKSIFKRQIMDQGLEKHLQQEKNVLETCHFPLIMQYYRSFKNDNCIFFLQEYIKGMELFDVIREIGLLNTYDSQFYIGSLLLCIEYLHTNDIIYRDIKPENILVDHLGTLKLIDLGTAKNLKALRGRTYTIIGTPHYMAPEIIRGKGYTYSVDLWSIGICLYEFMCGGIPFAEDAEDPYEIYEVVMQAQISFPSFLKDRKARKLMEQLLSKTPELRIGGSYAALKANPWFDNFDWDKLLEKEIKPPFVPNKTKIITDQEVQNQIKANKPVTKEIKVSKKLNHHLSIQIANENLYLAGKARDPNWDQTY